MKPIYYQSSEGVIINLIQKPYMMLTDTELLNSKWTPVTAGTNNPKIVALKKDLESPPFSIVVTGANKSEMLSNLDHIEGVFDRDCFLGEMGRLYIGDFYRDCFITSSTKEKVFEMPETVVQYVATSDNPYWRNDKEVIFSGSGMTTGEIAYSTIVTARINNESIIAEPTGVEGTELHLEYGAPFSYDNYLKFDIGSVIDVASFSGLELISQVGGTAISCDVQISSGARVDTAKQYTITESSAKIIPLDYTSITIVDYDTILYLQGYVGTEKVYEEQVYIGDTYDVSEFTSFKFANEGATETVDYTVNEEQWTTVDTISLVGGQETEVEIENVTCRYIRLLGAFFGSINSDISLISGEVAPPRDLFDLGFKSTNVSQFIINRVTTHQITIYPEDETKDAYITFDDLEVTLKEITCSSARVGTIKVQGLNDGVWTDILTFENGTSETYDTHYDQIRLCVPANSGVSAIQYAHINVLTDARVYNDSYAPSDAIIRLSGIWNNPQISIGGNVYGAELELQEGHTLEIDTVNHTVRDYSSEYAYENVFAKRLEGSFEKIETGENNVDWSGTHAVEIKLYQQRSTPKWN